MLVPESPLARLYRHAQSQGEALALIEHREDSWTSLTWSQLYRRVIDGASGMLSAGVRPGQVVVILLPAGARLVEIELASRAMGAIPLLLPQRLDPQEVATLLESADVGLVVVDEESRLELLRHADLADAQLYECDDSSWERLREVGAEDRTQRPGVLAQADAQRDPAATATMLGLPREKSAAWIFRPQASGATSDLKPGDVVLLVGETADRFTTVVRDAHQATGCLLAWVEGPDQLEAGLAQIGPTHVLLDAVAALDLDERLLEARVNGAPWHSDPRDVLDAAAAKAARARLNSRNKKLAVEVSSLAPWWGGRLRLLVLDGRVNRTVIGLAAGLGFQVGRIAHVPAVPIDLPKARRTRRRPAAPADTRGSASDASRRPRSAPLPRRARLGLDDAFTPAGL